VGPFMTPLDMAGFSLTLMRVDDALLAALDATSEVHAPTRSCRVLGHEPEPYIMIMQKSMLDNPGL